MSAPLKFVRLTEVSLTDLGGLLNHPDVRRHMPLAGEGMPESEIAAWVEGKERLWQERGYGPYAFVADGELVGWGGLQPEEGDVDLAIVLHPRHWTRGAEIFRRLTDEAFEKVGADSVIVLLPHSRTHLRGLGRLGLEPDGELRVGDVPFHRFRLWRKHRA